MPTSKSGTKKRAPRLGRGLSSLMATPVPVEPAQHEPVQAAKPQASEPDVSPAPSPASPIAEGNGRPAVAEQSETFRYLPVGAMTPNRSQPRTRFDQTALEGLAQSIRSEGLMQPIVVRPLPGGDGEAYELVAGERRWRAAQLAGLGSVPAIVRQLDNQQIAEWALVENLQREDLNPIERAVAFQKLIDGFSLSQQALAERVGMDRASVSNILRLLNLSEFTRSLVADDLLSMGQARALLGLPDPAAQDELAKRVVKQGLSVRQVEAEVRRLVGGGGKSSKPKTKANQLADLERQITEQLGTKVAIKPGRKKGSGTLAIDFYSLDQFDHLVGMLGVKTD